MARTCDDLGHCKSKCDSYSSLKEEVPQGYNAPANFCLTTVMLMDQAGALVLLRTSCYILDKKFEVEEFLKIFSGI